MLYPIFDTAQLPPHAANDDAVYMDLPSQSGSMVGFLLRAQFFSTFRGILVTTMPWIILQTMISLMTAEEREEFVDYYKEREADLIGGVEDRQTIASLRGIISVQREELRRLTRFESQVRSLQRQLRESHPELCRQRTRSRSRSRGRSADDAAQPSQEDR